MTDPSADAHTWGRDVLAFIQRHRSHVVGGLWSLMDEGQLDFLDALAVAPIILAQQNRRQLEAAEDDGADEADEDVLSPADSIPAPSGLPDEQDAPTAGEMGNSDVAAIHDGWKEQDDEAGTGNAVMSELPAQAAPLVAGAVADWP